MVYPRLVSTGVEVLGLSDVTFGTFPDKRVAWARRFNRIMHDILFDATLVAGFCYFIVKEISLFTSRANRAGLPIYNFSNDTSVVSLFKVASFSAIHLSKMLLESSPNVSNFELIARSLHIISMWAEIGQTAAYNSISILTLSLLPLWTVNNFVPYSSAITNTLVRWALLPVVVPVLLAIYVVYSLCLLRSI